MLANDVTDQVDVNDLIMAEGKRIVSAESFGSHERRVRMRVVTAAGRYLQRCAPVAPTEFMGTEVLYDGSRVDLVWGHPRLGVFFDELKTSRQPRPETSTASLLQVSRYAQAGLDIFADSFAGVRLIPLLAPDAALLAWIEDGAMQFTPLAQTALSLTHLRLNTAA
jgi:hypothetical protein